MGVAVGVGTNVAVAVGTGVDVAARVGVATALGVSRTTGVATTVEVSGGLYAIPRAANAVGEITTAANGSEPFELAPTNTPEPPAEATGTVESVDPAPPPFAAPAPQALIRAPEPTTKATRNLRRDNSIASFIPDSSLT